MTPLNYSTHPNNHSLNYSVNSTNYLNAEDSTQELFPSNLVGDELSHVNYDSQQNNHHNKGTNSHGSVLDSTLSTFRGVGMKEDSGREGEELNELGIEETIIYFLIFLLLVFLFMQMARCIRTTLDPYHTFARAAWFETLTKVRADAFV